MRNWETVLAVEALLDKEIAKGKPYFVFPAGQLSLYDPIVNAVARRIGDEVVRDGIKEIKQLDLRKNDAFKLVKNSSLYPKVLNHEIMAYPRVSWFLANL